jgi:uncharacterized protein
MGKRNLGIQDIIGDKRRLILAVAHKHGASNVRVFGSVARNQATATSDIDLLVDWDYARLTTWGSIGLWIELEALLERKVDIVSEDSLRAELRSIVMSEALLL